MRKDQRVILQEMTFPHIPFQHGRFNQGDAEIAPTSTTGREHCQPFFDKQQQPLNRFRRVGHKGIEMRSQVGGQLHAHRVG